MSKIALNKIVAVEKSVKSATAKGMGEQRKQLEKTTLLGGLSRTYRSKDEEGDLLPAEHTRVQVRATDVLTELQDTLVRLFDVVATKDWGNTHARANVEVDGEVLLKDVPVTYLLFLEKQLAELRGFVERLPTLDQAEVWRYDENQACYATEPVETHRTRKVPRTLVKYEATEHHPAQTEVWHEDVIVGFWKTIKYSGAMPAHRVKQLLDRIERLEEAVKFAREEANGKEVDDIKHGRKVMTWIFG